MTVLSVYAHDEPKSLTASLKNAAIGELIRQGHTVLETDLYAMDFSPVAKKLDFTSLKSGHFNYMLEQKHTAGSGLLFSPDIMAEIEKIAAADIIIFHTPLWWSGLPAILKGWFDRVFAMGVAWDAGKIYQTGLMRGKSALLCVTCGYPDDFYRREGKMKATILDILHPVQHGTLSHCGLDVIEPFIVYNSLGLTSKHAEQYINEYKFKIAHLFDSPAYLSKFD